MCVIIISPILGNLGIAALGEMHANGCEVGNGVTVMAGVSKTIEMIVEAAVVKTSDGTVVSKGVVTDSVVTAGE